MVVPCQRSFDYGVTANDENNNSSSNSSKSCPTTMMEKNIVDNVPGVPTPSMSIASSSDSRSSLTTSTISSCRNMISFSSSSSSNLIQKKNKKPRSEYKKKIDELKMGNMDLKQQHTALCQELEDLRAWVSAAPLIGMEHVTLAVDRPADFDDDCSIQSIKSSSSRSVFGKKVPRAEYEQVIETIAAENENIKTDSDRLETAIHDLQQWFSEHPVAK